MENNINQEVEEMKALSGFAQACYEQNTLGELIESVLVRRADKADCKAWKITAKQWREAVGDAMVCKIEEKIEAGEL